MAKSWATWQWRFLEALSRQPTTQVSAVEKEREKTTSGLSQRALVNIVIATVVGRCQNVVKDRRRGRRPVCEWRWKAFLYKICGGDRRERTRRGHQGIRIHVAHSPQATARQAGQIWPCCWDSGHRCRVRFQHVAKTRGAFPCQQAFGMQCRPPHHRNPGSSRRWGPGAHAMARQGGGVLRAAASLVWVCRVPLLSACVVRITTAQARRGILLIGHATTAANVHTCIVHTYVYL